MSWIKSKIVMIPTNKGSNICLYNYQLTTRDRDPEYFDGTDFRYIHQNLYFISDEEIKEGDFIYCDIDGNFRKGIHQITERNVDVANKLYTCKKIIVATDKSLGLPEPSKEFIELYCQKYNKGNKIDEVFIEQELKQRFFFDEFNKQDAELLNVVNVNSDNTINIKPIKESWSKEEVIDVVRKVLESTGKEIKAEMKQIPQNPYIVFDGEDLETWFKTNL